LSQRPRARRLEHGRRSAGFAPSGDKQQPLRPKIEQLVIEAKRGGTLLLANGVDVVAVSRLLGHTR
jgi:hypothetical protein